jgi:hypothetical protein
MQTLNWTNQCPLFMTVRHIFEISEDDHPSFVTHARDNWRTLDFPNAFVSPDINSRGELVPSHGPSRSRLGDYGQIKTNYVLPIYSPTLMILDVNECLSSPCGNNAACNNTEGSFICSCKQGFEGNGINCSGLIVLIF